MFHVSIMFQEFTIGSKPMVVARESPLDCSSGILKSTIPRRCGQRHLDILDPIYSSARSRYPDDHFNGANTLGLITLAIHTAEAGILECSGGKDWANEYYFLTLSFPFFGAAPGRQPDVPIWMGFAWVAWGHCEGSPKESSCQAQCLLKNLVNISVDLPLPTVIDQDG